MNARDEAYRLLSLRPEFSSRADRAAIKAIRQGSRRHIVRLISFSLRELSYPVWCALWVPLARDAEVARGGLLRLHGQLRRLADLELAMVPEYPYVLAPCPVADRLHAERQRIRNWDRYRMPGSSRLGRTDRVPKGGKAKR